MHPLAEQLKIGDEGLQAAIAACTQDIDAVAPELLALVEQAADGTLPESSQDAFFIGLFILAWARDHRLFPLLQRLVQRPGDELRELLGDARTDGLPRIVAGCFDGNTDTEALFALIANPAIEEFTRGSLWGAATFLTWDGRIDAAKMRAFVESYDDTRAMPDEDAAWLSWSLAIELLGWSDLAQRAERAYADDRIPSVLSDVTYFRKKLAAAIAAPGDLERFTAENLGYPEEPYAELAPYNDVALQEKNRVPGDDRWDRESGRLVPPPNFTPQQLSQYRDLKPVTRATPKVGRNDPCPCGSGKKYKRCCGAVSA